MSCRDIETIYFSSCPNGRKFSYNGVDVTKTFLYDTFNNLDRDMKVSKSMTKSVDTIVVPDGTSASCDEITFSSFLDSLPSCYKQKAFSQLEEYVRERQNLNQRRNSKRMSGCRMTNPVPVVPVIAVPLNEPCKEITLTSIDKTAQITINTKCNGNFPCKHLVKTPNTKNCNAQGDEMGIFDILRYCATNHIAIPRALLDHFNSQVKHVRTAIDELGLTN